MFMVSGAPSRATPGAPQGRTHAFVMNTQLKEFPTVGIKRIVLMIAGTSSPSLPVLALLRWGG